jgi:tRNA dimethylallyltransferase
MKKKPKLIIIVGPTASGKSSLAVKIALRLNSAQAKKNLGMDGAEIISADSRQVYKGMDIGTGKITKKEMQNIPHYLLDVISPKGKFTVVRYKNLAEKEIKNISKKNKIPIIVGGTGFYIESIIDGKEIPRVKPDWKLRKNLEKKSNQELYLILKKLDPRRAKNIDRNNPHRLIRAIEIVKTTKKPVPLIKKSAPKYNVLIIGIKKPKTELHKLIEKRLKTRFKQGMIKEVENLHKTGVSWKKLESFGLEYKWIAKYLQNKIQYEEMVEKLQKDIEHYAKRQTTWFKRNKKIHWVKNYSQSEKLIKIFCNEKGKP